MPSKKPCICMENELVSVVVYKLSIIVILPVIRCSDGFVNELHLPDDISDSKVVKSQMMWVSDCLRVIISHLPAVSSVCG